jgi:hypothetical protein
MSGCWRLILYPKTGLLGSFAALQPCFGVYRSLSRQGTARRVWKGIYVHLLVVVIRHTPRLLQGLQFVIQVGVTVIEVLESGFNVYR